MKNLILLHGALGSKSQMKGLKNLLQNDFKVHLLDFSGHGENPESQNFGIHTFTKDLLKFMDEQKIEKVNIFGYSMGGFVALLTTREHPERIEKIFTLGTKFDWNLETSAKEAAMLNPEKIKEKVPKFASALEQRHGAKWENLLKQTASMMLELGNQNPFTYKEAKSIKIPVLLSVGEHDNMVGIEETRKIQEKIPGSELKVLPATPHPIEKVDYEMLASEIRLFF